MKKLITIVGARPQFVKAAVVSRAIREHKSGIQEIIVHTGQHYDPNMSDIFFHELDIPKPHFHLGIGGGSHGKNTGRMIEKIEEILLPEKPDFLLVYGDTDSTLAGAIAASKIQVPIAHVEAGLRSYNRKMPEEINRVLTDHLSSILLTPTAHASRNLHKEGIDDSKIRIVGDTMYDAVLYYGEHAKAPTTSVDMDVFEKDYALCTIHRAENTDDTARLREILQGLASLPISIILPMHPRTRNRIETADIQLGGNIHVIEPVGYLEMIWLQKRASLILTDSGGVQKEAYFHKTPCITLRDETEWVELVDIGANMLAGADAEKIVSSFGKLSGFSFPDDPIYGNGDAGEQIVDALQAYMNSGDTHAPGN
ncbi:UDP-N-acetylglucosamine 2-epimerase (non-hydrolyzing) [Candidimonas humi]|uniref:Non-hydrolyzing UDP-N-acetylglucosamine 2-epimerase n=1 Tax=Candidimonas humi TaxID=683355 RepID=A0ABV8NYE5_9BURK|nr:UDP-N-acetylglucosamine 2-epimerase (non-hydrolyzing) [Candidimonas humi]MBV6305081.1 UDP-N-acetylglucosamine 2-epimerase (non-hydrolyzing) [Candidimonas humi]